MYVYIIDIHIYVLAGKSLNNHLRQCRKPSGDSDAVGRESGQGEPWNQMTTGLRYSRRSC